ncbi:helix-turn-helix domain-containing protein [Kistimonas scapharcae]|uniref:helix-turn-helix domain-containing protein n=1 Tax=Kistimonas scapharcae TaxID=1036133 RepID=UPI003CD0C312
MIRRIFALNLTIAMSRAGVSEKRLAKELGISQPAVSKWLNAKSLPRVGTFYQICKILNSSPNELLGWHESD